ncbi:MAG TPA: apolipoprotein N-acyltransferase [Candidatus Eisenbacteria bacterium]
MGVAFLPLPLGFLAWGAYVPLLVALDARWRTASGRALFGLGWTFGAAFFLIGTHWIALLSDVAITVPWLKYPAWVAAAAYLALFPGLATWAAGTLARRARLPLAAGFPLVWLAVEELRASGELGFPWFQPGYTQHAYAPLLQMAALGGVTLVTLWLLFLNVLLWQALRGGARLRSALGALLLVALPWSWGLRVLAAAPREAGPAVGLIQGNVPGDVKWSGEHQSEILAAFLGLSERALERDPRPAILIWPETATGSYLRRQPAQALEVEAFAARTRVPVFSGFADYTFGPDGKPRYFNAAGLFPPDGPPGPSYAKRHLVPFGERMPFEWLIPALGRIELGQAEWTPGRDAVLFPSAAGPFSCLVCFEAIFPDLARADVRRGARWLVNITNDEWFGNSAALYQHAAMARFRAVECRVPLARCANTGLTLVSDAYGRTVAAAPVFQATALVVPLPRPGRPSLYLALGDWPGLVSGIVVAIAVLVSLTRRARTAYHAVGPLAPVPGEHATP